MMKKNDKVDSQEKKIVRCAIYTRKSSEEGLEQDFNSLDAQRESAEAYIASQQHEGWICLTDRYDDGGFTGGNIERPAIRRLLADIEAGNIDCVVVYKVDRLSRSLLDFARMMSIFEEHEVSFVSVTQQFNTTHSMGRLTLNILLSFAQFEREIISERTRDKIAASRRKGKWIGGRPVLGYDLARLPGGVKITVNKEEAECVRSIYEMYLEYESIAETRRRLDMLGWYNKSWTTKDGRAMGGQPFNKSTLFHLLTNITYLGKVKYRDQVYEGEHDAIVEEDLFNRVQMLMARNRGSGGSHKRNKYGALLKGLVRCKACGCAMSHHFASKGNKRYRYYVCVNAQKNGWNACPNPSLPAGELEAFVFQEIRALDYDDLFVRDAVLQVHRRLSDEIKTLDTHRKTVNRDLRDIQTRINEITSSPDIQNDKDKELSKLIDRQSVLEKKASKLDEEFNRINQRMIDDDEIIGAMETFDPIWAVLKPRERERLVHLLVHQVEYDGVNETISVTFQRSGMDSFTNGKETHEEVIA